jgi:hypothetical protein
MTGNRKDVRKEVAAYLTANLVGTGKPLQAVYPYKKSDFGGASPVGLVISAGSSRPVFTARGRRLIANLEVWIFVLYADPNGASREAEAEDQIDDIEAALEPLLGGVEHEGMALDYRQATVVTQLPVGGLVYLWEIIPIQASLAG